MRLVLIGIQGAGKSTQGNLLSRQLGIPYLSTGHIFREMAKEKTKIGRYLKETMTAGFLIPDEKTIPIVNEYLSRQAYKKGYILDGFPRTLPQAKRFQNHVDKVIYLEIPDKEALWRLAYRNDHQEGREDDTIQAIKKRIDLFHKMTRPVVDFYKKQNKLIIVNGLQSIKQVNKEILKSLGKQWVANQIRDWRLKKKIMIAIVGLHGSGKTAASHYFAEKKLPVIRFGKVINDYIERHHLSHTEEHHKKVREDLRQKHGQEALARLNEAKIRTALQKSRLIIIDGMRSWGEYLYLKKQFTDLKIVILALYSDKEKRYQRIASRAERNQLKGEKRDLNELLGTHMGPTIAFADFLVDNNGSLEDLKNKLESIYQAIYFS